MMDPVEAFLAIPLAATCCDGLFSDQEAHMLQSRLVSQAHFLERSPEALREIVERLRGDAAMENWRNLVLNAVDLLSPQQREKAFILAVQLIHSDRIVAAEERDFVELLARTMSLSAEWCQGILAMFGILHREGD